jgi:hypothetical protein
MLTSTTLRSMQRQMEAEREKAMVPTVVTHLLPT